MDIQTIPFRRLPLPQGDGLDARQLRERVCQGLLVRHATAGPATDRLLAVTRDGVLTAHTGALRRSPEAVVALGRALGESSGSRAVFRTGLVRSTPRGDTLAVLELLDDDGWWLATCRPSPDDPDGTPAWSERTGWGPLPPAAGWWARHTDIEGGGEVGVRATNHLPDDGQIVAAAHATLDSDPSRGARALAVELATTMAGLLQKERTLSVVLALRGRRVSAFVLPPSFLGGLDEAMRAIATATGADTIAVLDGASADAPATPVGSRLTVERSGERTTVLLDSSALGDPVDADHVVLDVSSLGPRPLADRWVGRAPMALGVSLLGLRGLHPLPEA